MQIIDQKTTIQDILADTKNILQGEAVKGVVDLKRQILAIDEPMHADIEKQLIDAGSRQYDLWGINLHSDPDEDLVEFDSMINIRPSQGNRSRDVENPETQQQILDLVAKWITK